MQTLLNDIELDIHELKCLLNAITSDANPALRVVAKRNIRQMQMRLDALLQSLDEIPEPTSEELVVAVKPPVAVSEKPIVSPAPEKPVAIVPDTPVVIAVAEPIVTPGISSSILAERIKPAQDLRHAISLNDSFRFTRELFGSDSQRMNEVVRRLGEAPSLEKAMQLFTSEVSVEEENEAASDFVELLKKYFS